jgi:CheY-like chemotaxis protein
VPRILVADDNTNIQKMVALAFQERGIDVVSVGNGEAAVRRIPEVIPDLILADVFMPVRNGYEVCEFVKRDERFSHVPVILLVGAFDPLDEKEARRVGADGVLKKPFVPPDPLIAMVTSALEKNPRVAAEMARAKEAVVEPPPEPVLENPARQEPKPLPEFPEPSPEEAAVIYGFGKGVRNLDDVADKPEEPKTPKEPVADGADQAEGGFDGAETTHDWRRSAALSIEVPEEPGGSLAFSSDADFKQITFPSEEEVPPRSIHTSESAEESEPATSAEAPLEVPKTEEIVLASAREPEVLAARTELDSEDAIKAEAKPAPVEESKPADWMALTPPPSEYPDGGWLSEAAEAHRDEEPPETVAPSPASPGDATEAKTGPEAKPTPPETTSHSAPEEPFFAEEPSAPQTWFAPSSSEVALPDTTSGEVANARPDLDNEFVVAADDNDEPTLRDPALEEPPAPHVTPEPLLLRDGPLGPSKYGGRPEETAPMHSFFAPASGEPFVAEQAAEEAPAEVVEASSEQTFSTARTEEVGERNPTITPPDRGVLSEIPFLAPPPPASSTPPAVPPNGVDPATVTAVVQKVLEKLEPQLHELLSQGVLKPLVENLLQQEGSKGVK